MNALREIGVKRAVKFGALTLAHAGFQMLLFPPLRVAALRFLGARVDQEVIIHSVRFFNFDRTGFTGLRIGHHGFLGDECLIDLANEVVLEEHVTLAPRVTVLTHTNVGYADHPLQAHLRTMTAPVKVRRGAFIGACAMLLPGIEVGEAAVVGAGSVVCHDVPPYAVVTGVPARVRRWLREAERSEVSVEHPG